MSTLHGLPSITMAPFGSCKWLSTRISFSFFILINSTVLSFTINKAKLACWVWLLHSSMRWYWSVEGGWGSCTLTGKGCPTETSRRSPATIAASATERYRWGMLVREWSYTAFPSLMQPHTNVTQSAGRAGQGSRSTLTWWIPWATNKAMMLQALLPFLSW